MAKSTVKWKDSEQVGWSAGYCQYCQNLEAIRVEDVIEVRAVNFVPISRRVIGRNGVCDFCERPLERVVSDKLVAQRDWMPPDGMPKLLRGLGIQREIAIPTPTPDARLRSLLSATQEASSLANVNILTGLVAGLVAGIVLGMLCGIVLFGLGMHFGAADRLGVAMVTATIGAVLDAVVGAAAYGFLIRTRTAQRKMLRATQNYTLDIARLCELSPDYNLHVQCAVSAVASEE